jgi:hypothetical protein
VTLVETKITPPPQPARAHNGRHVDDVTNGEAAAALLAAGIGSLALGILTTLAAASADFANLLKISANVGPLSGKVIYTIVLWLIAWGTLHYAWRARQVDFGKMFTLTLGLIGLGFLGTFPIFYDLFVPK